MQQITLYYTENLKYLKLGDYIKYFKSENIDEMLAKIKNQETPVKIRANKEDVIKHKLSDSNKIMYSYEILPEKLIFGKSSVENILQDFINSNEEYMDYGVIEMWQNTLGKSIFVCNSREMQLKIVAENVFLAFTPPDLDNLYKGMLNNGKIPQLVCYRMYNTDEEMKEIEQLLATQEGR